MSKKISVASDTKTEKIESSPQLKTTEIIQNLKSIPSEKIITEQIANKNLSVLQLPSDFTKSPDTTYIAGYDQFALSPCLVESLKVQVQRENIALNSLLLAAFKIILHRYTQQEEIQVGLKVISGIDSDYATVVSTHFSSDITVRGLIGDIPEILAGEVQKDSLKSAILANSETEILQKLLPIALTFRENCVDTQTETQWLEWFKAQNWELLGSQDLHLVIACQEQSISGIWVYNTNLFLPETIQRLSGHLQTLLAGIAQNLDQPLIQLPLITSAEQHQLLVEWNSPSVNYPQIPIFKHIEAHAVQYPEAIAITCKQQHFTYAQLNQRANQLAHYLTSVGLVAGDRVAVCIQPSLDIGIALLGIFKAGGVYVPLDFNHPIERLTSILEDTQAKVLLTQTQLLPNLPAIAEHTLCFDQDWEKISAFGTHNPDHVIDLDQTAYLIYTSGTTGKPKGVMASHRNLVNYILATQERLGFNRHDVMPSVARFTFSIALFELLSPLAAGGTLVLLEREHVLDFPRFTQTLEQLTMLHTVPSLMQKLVTYIKEHHLDLQKFQGMKHVFTGGDTVPPDLLEVLKEVFPNAKVAVLYGCSEVSSLCATFPVSREQTITKSRVGKPFNNVSIRLYDPHQNLVPIGVPGEIYVGGAGVTQGYLNRDELTQEKFVTIGGQQFYRTGDLGRFGADGNLEFLGRADFQIKLRGIRIELGDIESTLRRAPGVREGVVMACDLGSGEKSLVAYVVLDQAQNPTIPAIRQFLQAKLPDYMVPAGFVVLEAMPLNPNQKVDRRALPLPTPENLAGDQSFVAPRNEWEQQLTAIWEKVLGIQPIGIHNNFFELGGNSLLAVEMLSQVEQLWGKKLLITRLLKSPTVEDLAKVVSNMEEDSEESIGLIPLRASGTKPPLFCLYGILLYQELTNHLSPDQPVYAIYLPEEIELLKTGKIDLQNAYFMGVPNIAVRYLEIIRTHQPHGPYYLAGESFGGVVALEMAQQLKAAGEEVALVSLLDSLSPKFTPSGKLIQEVQLYLQRLKKYGFPYFLHIMQKNTQLAQQKLVNSFSKISERFSSAADTTSQTILEVTQDEGDDDIRAEFRWQMHRSYVPKPYDGRMVLFRATERDQFEICDHDLGWGTTAVGNFDVFDVPGDHLGILKSPNVQVMAEIIQACIDATIAEQSDIVS